MRRLLSICCASALACSSGSNGTSGPSDAGQPDTFILDDCLPECDVETDAFFAPDRLATLRLEIDEKLLADEGYAADQWLEFLGDRWQHCGPYENYVPVTFTYEHPETSDLAVLERVGMRIRGTGVDKTESGQRTGFKLHLSTLLPEPPPGEPRRHFADLNRINLLSVEGDDSVMVQCLVYQMVGAFGVPAPRCNHVRVYVNGEYYGIMQNAEEPDDGRYVRHRLGDGGGQLYEVNHDCGHDTYQPLRYLGPTYAGSEYESAYFLDVIGNAGNPQDQIVPMLFCADPTTTPDDGDFAACIAEWIDVDEWLRLIAAEMVMPNAESMAGLGRNFYLYFRPDAAAPHGGRFQAYSWDMDGTFWVNCSADCDIFNAVPDWFMPGEAPVVVSRLRNVFRDEYCALVKEFHDTIFTVDRVDAIADVIHDAMVPGGVFEDTDPTFSSEVWLDRVDDLRWFIGSGRPAELAPQLLTCP